MIELLHKECTPERSSINLQQFRLAIQSGLFAIILDGFDEVEHSIRRVVSKNIDRFANDYPTCPILISSRPDNDVFQSWAKFEIVEVEDFDRRQTIELIKNSKYNNGVKDRFLKALEDRLFSTHGSFLQSPLLTIIMLLTFEEFAEIPNRMHAFYARAFDTLFQKHDADKEQFVRKTRTGLSREDFRSVLSAFCGMSYIDSKYSFDRANLEKYIEAGIQYANKVHDSINVKKSNFILDLKDAVCLIQEDGLEYVFVHRSFQEYFTAVFIEKLHGENVRKILDRLSYRYNDNAVTMAIDLAREKIETEWLIPTLEELLPIFSSNNGRRNSGIALSELIGAIHMLGRGFPNEDDIDEENETTQKRYPSNEVIMLSFPQLTQSKFGVVEIICRSFAESYEAISCITPIIRLTYDDLRKVVENDVHVDKPRQEKLLSFVKTNFKKPGKSIHIEFNEHDAWWLDSLGMSEALDKVHSTLNEIKISTEKRIQSRFCIIDDLLK